MPAATFSHNLKQLRSLRGLTTRKLAKKARLTGPYITALEQDRRSPSVMAVHRLGQALNLKGDDLQRFVWHGALTRRGGDRKLEKWGCIALIEALRKEGWASEDISTVKPAGRWGRDLAFESRDGRMIVVQVKVRRVK
jgi:transcriptional regulator with XRE-family HTH domain